MDLRNTPFKSLQRAPVADQVADALQARIAADFKPGDPLPSMRELCRQFGVSINTVQTAIAALAREGIVQRRPGSGVYVTERKNRRRIGILSELNLLDPHIGLFYRAQANALKQQFHAAGYEAHLYMGHYVPGPAGSGDTTCPQFWAEAEAGKLDGAVILDAPYRHPLSKRIQNCPVPAVGSMTGFEVKIDFRSLTTAAVRRLVTRGCRRIGILGWAESGIELFRQTIADCGLTPNEAWIRCDADPAVGGAGWEEFREIWAAPCGRPDGLVVLDDMLFADAQLAILELGIRVPNDLQLAVQSTRGSTRPIRLPVTLYEFDPAEAAALHVALLLDRLNGRTPAIPQPTIPFRERMPEDVAPGVAPGVENKAIGGRAAVIEAGNDKF